MQYVNSNYHSCMYVGYTVDMVTVHVCIPALAYYSEETPCSMNLYECTVRICH